MSSAEEIQKQIEELQSKLDKLKKNARTKIDKMSSEVKDTNPYSRLMALQRMGIVKDYENIRTKSVAVVGKISAHQRSKFNVICEMCVIDVLTHQLSCFRCWWSWICDCRYVDSLWNWKTHPLRL